MDDTFLRALYDELPPSEQRAFQARIKGDAGLSKEYSELRDLRRGLGKLVTATPSSETIARLTTLAHEAVNDPNWSAGSELATWNSHTRFAFALAATLLIGVLLILLLAELPSRTGTGVGTERLTASQPTETENANRPTTTRDANAANATNAVHRPVDVVEVATRNLDQRLPRIRLSTYFAKGGGDYEDIFNSACQRADSGDRAIASRLFWSLFNELEGKGAPSLQADCVERIMNNALIDKQYDVAQWANDLQSTRFPTDWSRNRAGGSRRSPQHNNNNEGNLNGNANPTQNSVPRDWNDNRRTPQQQEYHGPQQHPQQQQGGATPYPFDNRNDQRQRVNIPKKLWTQSR